MTYCNWEDEFGSDYSTFSHFYHCSAFVSQIDDRIATTEDLSLVFARNTLPCSSSKYKATCMRLWSEMFCKIYPQNNKGT